MGNIKTVRGRGAISLQLLTQDGGPLCTSLLCHLERSKEKPGRRSPGGVGGGGWEVVWRCGGEEEEVGGGASL